MSRDVVLVTSLQAAVPLWAEQHRALPADQVVARARSCASVIAGQGDVLQFGSKRRGEAAAAFNRLAEGVAALSLMPGGVTVFGAHFETRPPHPGLTGGL